MKRLLFAAALAIGALLATAGCDRIGAPETPQQKVFAAGTGYETATKAALVYLTLPRCAAPKVQPCSEPGVVEQVKKADAVVYAALIQAKTVVVDPSKTATVANAAVTALQSALTVFNAVLAQYQIGGS